MTERKVFSMADTKLFVSCHKQVTVPEHPLLVPIHVGAAISEKSMSGALRDDIGENISKKNRSYCELTAQYWAWKNIQADYYGFFHYRRYLYPDMTAKRPYRICDCPTNDLLKKLGYDNFAQIIERYDLIAPMGERVYLTVREQFSTGRRQRTETLRQMESVVWDVSPGYGAAMEEYLSGEICYFCNMFIMSARVFDAYCAWLFPILAEYDRRAAGARESRIDGYLAERLFGVFYYRHRKELKTAELPRVHYDAIAGRPDRRRRTIYRLLPPGTRRRAFSKQLFAWKD